MTATKKRADSGSRVIKASPQVLYQAYLDPEAVAAWRPPAGMTAQLFKFEPHEGGSFRMSFNYTDTSIKGKTSDNADVFGGYFKELVPNQHIVEVVNFESDDPDFAEPMTVITTLEPVAGGTKVTVTCENVPHAINADDHAQGIASSLQNLADYTEKG